MARINWFRFFARESALPAIDGEAGAGTGDRVDFGRFFDFFVARPNAAAAHAAETGAPAAPPTPAGNPDLQFQIAASSGGLFEIPTASASDAGPTAPATATVTDPAPVPDLAASDGARTASVAMGVTPQLAVNAGAASGLGGAGADYGISISDTFSTLVFDAHTKQVMPGGAADTPALGDSPEDTLELSGDFSSGVVLPAIMPGIDQLVVRAGHDYDLSVGDDFVDRGHTLMVNAMPLDASDHFRFDGSAETDGRFAFFGSEGNDIFFGGAGDDRLAGLGGADMMSGGGGHDTFFYTGAGESTGTVFDTLIDFNPAEDRIDLPGAVSSMGAAIDTGSLSLATFNADLAAALGGLGASQATLFAPDAGDFAGKIFLVVDANGVAGYQAGEDYVFAITGATLADLTSHGTGIFV